MALSSRVLSSGRRQPLHGGPGDSRLIGTVFSCPLLRSSSTPSQWTRGLASEWHRLLMSSPQVVVHPFTVDQGLALNGSLLVLPCCWPLDVRQYVVPQVAFSHDIARCQLRLWLKYCFQNTSHTSQLVVKAMGPFFSNGAVLILVEEIGNNKTFI